MSLVSPADLGGVLALQPAEQIEPLIQVATSLADSQSAGGVVDVEHKQTAIEALLTLLDAGQGTGRQRLLLGEALGRLGDPRLKTPGQTDYWTTTQVDERSVMVGRYMVTTAEFRHFIDSGQYDDLAHWSADGIAWRNTNAPSWKALAADAAVAHLVIDNQPAVGVTWFEAEAYAAAHGSRLPTAQERRWIVRGAEKRPYPWGAPFGSGNSNTREESLGKPSAVGLYKSDCTPEGVWDLAGNVGEWTQDGTNDKRVLHPGSWVRPSMASWAKALEMASPDVRSADLGFRLVR